MVGHGVDRRLMPGWEMVTCELTAYGARARKVWVNGTPSQVMYLVGPIALFPRYHDHQINHVFLFFSLLLYIFIDPSMFLYLAFSAMLLSLFF